MNGVQRMWLVGSLVVVGLALAITAFEWRDHAGIGITFYTIPDTAAHSEYLPKQRITATYAWGSNGKEYGICVRPRWGAAAVAWGGFLPLCLFAVAGFVALGGRSKK